MSFRSIKREVNSSVSLVGRSILASGGSSRAIGGNGESGKSENSGTCFSFLTRSDCGISVTVGSMRIGGWSSIIRFISTTFSSRSTTAWSPASRSRRASIFPLMAWNSHSTPAPIFSASLIHERPLKTLNAPADNASSKTVPPRKPNPASTAPARSPPTTPPGPLGSDVVTECRRNASKVDDATSNKTKPVIAMAKLRWSNMLQFSTRRNSLTTTHAASSTSHQAERPNTPKANCEIVAPMAPPLFRMAPSLPV